MELESERVDVSVLVVLIICILCLIQRERATQMRARHDADINEGEEMSGPCVATTGRHSTRLESSVYRVSFFWASEQIAGPHLSGGFELGPQPQL